MRAQYVLVFAGADGRHVTRGVAGLVFPVHVTPEHDERLHQLYVVYLWKTTRTT